MRHFVYLGVLAACLLSALWLEPLFRLGVTRRRRRLALTLLPVVTVFVAWDVAAIAAGHWHYDPGQLVGILLPGGLPLEELLFFLVVPVCAILGFEAVRKVTGWSVHRRGGGRSDDRHSNGGPSGGGPSDGDAGAAVDTGRARSLTDSREST